MTDLVVFAAAALALLALAVLVGALIGAMIGLVRLLIEALY